MIANHEQEYAVVHFVVVVLNMLCIAPLLILLLVGNRYQPNLDILGMTAVCSWPILFLITFVMVCTGHKYWRLGVAGLLAAVAISFLIPAYTG